MAAKSLDSGNLNKISPELPRLTSELASQAAMRAQQLLRKQIAQEDVPLGKSPPLYAIPLPQHMTNKLLPTQENRPVPAIPARSADRAPPPEIPPKRHSLKTLPDGFNLPPPGRLPPPLPKKPASAQNSAHSSAQNSPLLVSKLCEKGVATLAKPEQKQLHSSNPFDLHLDKNVPSPAPQRASDVKKLATSLNMTTISSSNNLTPAFRVPLNEDYGSEDALRGIESGLRNMERAMQEQMNLRSLEAVQNNFDMEFKAALNCGSRHVPTGIGLNTRPNIFERNLSMDESVRTAVDVSGNSSSAQSAAVIARQSFEELKQLRTQQLQQNASTTNLTQLEQSQQQAMRSTIENHMRSLDRNMPLEHQYGRRSHGPTLPLEFTKSANAAAGVTATKRSAEPIPLSSEFREHIRQQLLGNIPGNVVHNTGQSPGSAAAAALLQHQAQSRAAAVVVASQAGAAGVLTRDEIRMRRRSSHEESQLTQGPIVTPNLVAGSALPPGMT